MSIYFPNSTAYNKLMAGAAADVLVPSQASASVPSLQPGTKTYRRIITQEGALALPPVGSIGWRQRIAELSQGASQVIRNRLPLVMAAENGGAYASVEALEGVEGTGLVPVGETLDITFDAYLQALPGADTPLLMRGAGFGAADADICWRFGVTAGDQLRFSLNVGGSLVDVIDPGTVPVGRWFKVRAKKVGAGVVDLSVDGSVVVSSAALTYDPSAYVMAYHMLGSADGSTPPVAAGAVCLRNVMAEEDHWPTLMIRPVVFSAGDVTVNNPGDAGDGAATGASFWRADPLADPSAVAANVSLRPIIADTTWFEVDGETFSAGIFHKNRGGDIPLWLATDGATPLYARALRESDGEVFFDWQQVGFASGAGNHKAWLSGVPCSRGDLLVLEVATDGVGGAATHSQRAQTGVKYKEFCQSEGVRRALSLYNTNAPAPIKEPGRYVQTWQESDGAITDPNDPGYITMPAATEIIGAGYNRSNATIAEANVWAEWVPGLAVHKVVQGRGQSSIRTVLEDGTTLRDFTITDLPIHQRGTLVHDGDDRDDACFVDFYSCWWTTANYVAEEELPDLFASAIWGRRLSGDTISRNGEAGYPETINHSGSSIQCDHLMTDLDGPACKMVVGNYRYDYDPISGAMMTPEIETNGSRNSNNSGRRLARFALYEWAENPTPWTANRLMNPDGAYTVNGYRNGDVTNAGADKAHQGYLDDGRGLELNANLWANALVNACGFSKWVQPAIDDDDVWIDTDLNCIVISSKQGPITTRAQIDGDTIPPGEPEVEGYFINNQRVQRADLVDGRIHVYADGIHSNPLSLNDFFEANLGNSTGTIDAADFVANQTWKRAPIVNVGLKGLYSGVHADESVYAGLNNLYPLDRQRMRLSGPPAGAISVTDASQTLEMYQSYKYTKTNGRKAVGLIDQFTFETVWRVPTGLGDSTARKLLMFSTSPSNVNPVRLSVVPSTGALQMRIDDAGGTLFTGNLGQSIPLNDNAYHRLRWTVDLSNPGGARVQIAVDGVTIYEPSLFATTGNFPADQEAYWLPTNNGLLPDVQYFGVWPVAAFDDAALDFSRVRMFAGGSAAYWNESIMKAGPDFIDAS